MKITIENTEEIVVCNGAPVRVWRGTTERGSAVVALVARIGIDRRSDCCGAMERELVETPAPSEIERERDALLNALAHSMAKNLVAKASGR